MLKNGQFLISQFSLLNSHFSTLPVLVLVVLQIPLRALADIPFQRVLAGQGAGDVAALGLVERLGLGGVGHAVRDRLRAELRNKLHDGLDRGRGPLRLAQVADDLLAEHHVIHWELGELHQRRVAAAETGEQEVEAEVPQIGNGLGVPEVALGQQLAGQLEAHAVGVQPHGLHAADQLRLGALLQQKADGHVDREPLEEEVSLAEVLFRLQPLGQLQIEERHALVGKLRHLAEVFRDQRSEAGRVQPGPGLEEDHAAGLDLADGAVIHLHRAQAADVDLRLLYGIGIIIHNHSPFPTYWPIRFPAGPSGRMKKGASTHHDIHLYNTCFFVKCQPFATILNTFLKHFWRSMKKNTKS